MKSKLKDGKPLAVGTLDKLLWNGAGSRHYLLSLFQYRTMVACYKANRALHYSVEVEKLSIDDAWGKWHQLHKKGWTEVSHDYG